MCIYFQTLFYRRDGVNFYYTVDARLVLTDIYLGKILKIRLGHGATYPRRETDVVSTIFLTRSTATSPRHYKFVFLYCSLAWRRLTL